MNCSLSRYTLATLGGVALVAVGGVFFLWALSTPSPPRHPIPIDVEQITFSSGHPAYGWMVGQTNPRSPSILYRTTNNGRQWHKVRSLPSLGYSDLLAVGGTIWIPIQTATHSLRRSLALAYSRKPYVQWSSQPLIATTRSVPWEHYITLVMPQHTLKAPWLLAESQWNTEGLFSLFHYEPKRRHWTAVDPVPLGLRGQASPGITVTGPGTLWWSSGGTGGAAAQLDRVTVARNHARVQAAILPGLPVRSACAGGSTVLTDRSIGVPVFQGPQGQVMASWAGCQGNSRVYMRTWVTNNGGQSWHPMGGMPRGATTGMWASLSVGYVWSVNGKHWWATRDGGKTWKAAVLPPSIQLQTLDVVRPQNLWAIAGHREPYLLHSTDAGIHWIPVSVRIGQ